MFILSHSYGFTDDRNTTNDGEFSVEYPSTNLAIFSEVISLLLADLMLCNILFILKALSQSLKIR